MTRELPPSQKLSSSSQAPELADADRVRAHLAAIVDSSEDGIVSKTLEGIVTSWNKGAQKLFGYTADEMIGQSITRIIPPELHHEEAHILAKLRRGERIERYEAIRVHKDGHRLNISLTISPMRDASGRIVGAAKIAHDITRNKQAEKALQAELTARRAAEEALRESESRLRQVVTER